MQYQLIKTSSRIICLLPYQWLLTLGRWLGWLYYRVAKKQRQLAINQIQERMQLTTAEAETIIKKLFVNLAQSFLEMMYMPRLTPETIDQYVEFENRHYLDDAMAEGKGVAILAAHFGNWEWLGAALSLNGYPITTVMAKQPNDQHTELLNEYRRRTGMEVYAKGASEIVGIIKAFKRGRAVGLISDLNAGSTGITLDFFGKPASTHSSISVFAAKFGCPVVPAFILRLPEGGHRVLIQEPLYFEHTGHQAADITAFTAKLSKIVETIIRKHPEHWMWFHQRWRNPERGRPPEIRSVT